MFPCDQLPTSFIRYPSAYVSNTDPISHPGTHWVAFYHESPSSLEFFDSYGLHPPKPGPIGAVRSKQQTGDIRLEMKFRQATNANITPIVRSEEPATLEIDKFNHVLI